MSNSHFFLSILFFTFISFSVLSQENLKIKEVKFYGNNSISRKSLLNVINTKPRHGIEKIDFLEKQKRFSYITFKEDIIRLKKHYQQNGFLNPMISYKFFPNKNNKKLKIEITIIEGNAINVGKVDYVLIGDSIYQKVVDTLIKTVPLKSFMRFNDQNVILTEKAIEDKFQNYGYMFAKVSKEITLDDKNLVANVVFKITPGQKLYLGKITLQGNYLVSQKYIKKHIEINEGKKYSKNTIKKTQEQLFDMKLFNHVVVRPLIDSVKDDKIPILIELTEFPKWSFEIAAGYGTEDSFRGSIQLTRLNFFGPGRKLIFKAKHSYFTPYNFDIKVIQNKFILKNLSFILNPFILKERLEDYKIKREGIVSTFQLDINSKKSIFFSYNLGIDALDFSNMDVLLLSNATKNTKSSITLGHKANITNNLFYPSKGYKLNTSATYMGLGFGSEFHYFKIITELSYFFPIGKKVVVAHKVKGGLIEPLRGDLTPIEDRFLMGGALSLRGWARNSISPVNKNATKVGGNLMFENSVELRFPIYNIISGVTFIDAGNVWKNSGDFNLKNLKYDIGIGARIKSPIGPIRLDLAIPISENKLPFQFILSIGHAF